MSRRSRRRGAPRRRRAASARGVPGNALAQATAAARAGRPELAEQLCRAVLERAPDDADALHLLGLLAHQRGRHDEAAALIERALQQRPGEAVLRFNLGEVQRAAGRPDAALASYRRALELDAGMYDAHFGMGDALFEQGRFAEAAEAYRAAVAAGGAQDAELHNNLGNALAGEGDLEGAEEAYRRALGLRPGYAEARVNLADALRRRGRHAEAAECCRRALDLQPDLAAAHLQLGRVRELQNELEQARACYQRALELDAGLAEAHLRLGALLEEGGSLGPALLHFRRAAELEPDSVRAHARAGGALQALDRHAEALAELERAAALAPEAPEALCSLAACLHVMGRREEAQARFERALELDPRSAETRLRMGMCLQNEGRFDEALRCYREALAIRPDYAEAWYHLGANRGYQPDEEEMDSMREMLAREDLPVDTRMNLHFALGRILDGRDRHEEAFAHFREANALKAQRTPFDPGRYARYVDRIIEVFDAAFFAARREAGAASDLPVFIVGMPRSGSTLVEQIIASHPRVFGAGERHEMPQIVDELPGITAGRQPFPECAAALEREDAAALGGRYLEAMRRLAPDAERVCDKMLGNFLRLGLIAVLLPGARVVHCRRDPVATCLSCYFQHFAHGLRFSYDLGHLGFAYRQYQRLMAHWREVLPLEVLDVQYEELTARQEAVSRRLVEFCGLAWDARCLRFHEHERAVQSSSYWQVRQPMYRASVARWKHYEKHLAPLREALEGR